MKISDIVQDWNELPWACFYGPGDTLIPKLNEALIENICEEGDKLIIKVRDSSNSYMSHIFIDDENLKQVFLNSAEGKSLLEAYNISTE